MTIEFLLVSCALEESRAQIFQQVVDNLLEQAPYLKQSLTVFDNASTVDVSNELLKFDHSYVSDKNVGYWTAIDWWLSHISDRKPKYTYIIESDMIHYNLDLIWSAEMLLTENADIGSVRLHEYSVQNKHLYNKDEPVNGSKRNIWQSHTNKVTNQRINLERIDESMFYRANFLTQLPSLNRFNSLKRCFARLRQRKQFSELDFQRFYHDIHPINSILDGGIFHCDPGCNGAATITGSWSNQELLNEIGYQPTRQGYILEPSQYNVRPLK